ncbi:uncharacterized protein [Ambystoma mexicanum]|uniref:uncharacterized protein n=1 Tax=Ambystoma mexicanum TaxID=8296 RepID=UPI0037E96305
MNREDYIAEANRQLKDPKCYKLLDRDPTSGINDKLFNLLMKWREKGLLEDEMCKYLHPKFPVMPTIYFLPKVHKNKIRPPGRPIVTLCGALLENVSKLVDETLIKFVTSLPSYLRDTKDFLNKIDGIPWQNTDLLATLDVVSLYTSIKHTDGLKSCEYFLKTRSLNYLEHTKMILEMINICLTNNSFLFNNKFYTQLQGTAMGTTFAPSYANLTMGWWEKFIVWTPPNSHHTDKVVLWLRYIDDLFIIWDGTTEEWLEFVKLLNVNEYNLQFTECHSKTDIVYLDILVTVTADGLVTELYRKPTSSNTPLHAKSSHPTALKWSIPYGEFIRIRRNCSQLDTYDKICRDMAQKFLQRGYPKKVLERAYIKARQKDRSTLLMSETQKETVKEETDTRLILTFSEASKHIRHIIHKHWHVLKQDEHLKSILGPNVNITFRRSTSLKDNLVSSYMSPKTPQSTSSWLNANLRGFQNCAKCKACKFGRNIKNYLHPVLQRYVPIKSRITCGTEYVVYVLTCSCDKWYVGSTIGKLKLRILQHIRAIKNVDPTYPMALHFQEKHGGRLEGFEYFGIYTVPKTARGGNRELSLRQSETRYILDLETKKPKGHNLDEELHTFLGT